MIKILMFKISYKYRHHYPLCQEKVSLGCFHTQNLLFHFRCCNLGIAIFLHLFIYNTRFKPSIRSHVIETKARKK